MKTWVVSRYSIDSIFLDITSILKAEMTTAGTAPGENSFNNEKGHILFRATNISGFGRTHVRWVRFLLMLLCCALRFVTPVVVQKQHRKNDGRTYKLECNFERKNGCPVQVRIKEDATIITLELNGRHDKNSHKGAFTHL